MRHDPKSLVDILGGKPSHGGARKGSGRKRTAPPRATISLTFPLPIVEAYRALDEKTAGALRLKLRLAVESECVPK